MSSTTGLGRRVGEEVRREVVRGKELMKVVAKSRGSNRRLRREEPMQRRLAIINL